MIPLYFRAVADIWPPEVLAHRAWWSFALLAVCVYFLGRWNDLWQRLHDGKAVGMLATSALLMALNWLTFIAPSAQFRLHLDGHPDLYAGFPPLGAAGSRRSGGARLK